jgi:hypothetical protein
MKDQPFTRPLPTHRTTQTQNKRTQTSMPRVGFKTMISVFAQAKTVHALDCAATVIGSSLYIYTYVNIGLFTLLAIIICKLVVCS